MPEPATDTPRTRVPLGRIGVVALRPGFLVGHLVVIALAITTIWLGRWQWHAAHVHHGSVQNYAYAFQWWIFCAFGLAMWFRIMRDRAARDVERGPAASPTVAERRTAEDATAPAGYRAYAMPTADQIDAHDPDDAVRSTYNAALARRHSGDR